MIGYFDLNLGECLCVHNFEHVGIAIFIIAYLSCLLGITFFYNNLKLMPHEFGIGENYISKLRVSHFISKLRVISTVHI